MKRVKVLLADSEEVFREGLAKILEEQQRIEVVSRCNTGEEAVAKSKEARPDLVVLDDLASDVSTPDIIKRLVESLPRVAVAVICHPEKVVNVVDIIQAGGRACLSKTSSVSDMVKSLDLISRGRIIISPVFAEAFLQEITLLKRDGSKEQPYREHPLSDRELEIVHLIVKGKTNKEIAVQLGIAENTVKAHMKNILGKLELDNRQQLITHAIMEEWVTVGDVQG